MEQDYNHCFIVKEYFTCLHACLLSKAPQASKILEFITKAAEENPDIAESLFVNCRQTSEYLKFSVVCGNSLGLKNKVIRQREIQHIYLQL